MSGAILPLPLTSTGSPTDPRHATSRQASKAKQSRLCGAGAHGQGEARLRQRPRAEAGAGSPQSQRPTHSQSTRRTSAPSTTRMFTPSGYKVTSSGHTQEGTHQRSPKAAASAHCFCLQFSSQEEALVKILFLFANSVSGDTQDHSHLSYTGTNTNQGAPVQQKPSGLRP